MAKSKHALRALFNCFRRLYADVRTFTEHPVTTLGKALEPAFYKSSDENHYLATPHAASTKRMGHPSPRVIEAWFHREQPFGVEAMATYFGAVSFEVRPSVLRTTVTLRRDPNHTRARLLPSIVASPASASSNRRDRFARSTTFKLPIPRDDNVIVVPPRLTSCISGWNAGEAQPLSNQEHSRA